MKIEKDEITIRDFTETDLPLMFKWLTDKRVLEYYEGRDVRFTMDQILDTIKVDTVNKNVCEIVSEILTL